jgi:hypothetical protein
MNLKKANQLLELVTYPEYVITATEDGRGEMYLQASYMEADIYTEKPALQQTRRWFISPHMTKSELVQTAFKCIMTSMEHRVREHFKYRDALVFGPHFNVDDLCKVAKKRKLDRRKQ